MSEANSATGAGYGVGGQGYSPATNEMSARREGVADAASNATNTLRDTVSNLQGAARDAVSQAGDKLQSAVEGRKAAGADYVREIAEAVRRAGEELDSKIPRAGHYADMAAEQIEFVSDALRRRDLSELLTSARDFARRQPTVFVCASMLAGLAAVRFVKTSASAATTSDTRQG